LLVSNARKSIKPASSVFQETGAAISVISCPATSSMTTQPGSLRPSSRATRVAAGIPIATATAARMMAVCACHCGASERVTNHHISTVAAEPHVPGASGNRPAPKNVATTHAQAPARKTVFAPAAGCSTVVIAYFSHPADLLEALRAHCRWCPEPETKSRIRRWPTSRGRLAGNAGCRKGTQGRYSLQASRRWDNVAFRHAWP
jgi:hypothetical protein